MFKWQIFSFNDNETSQDENDGYAKSNNNVPCAERHIIAK